MRHSGGGATVTNAFLLKPYTDEQLISGVSSLLREGD